MAGYGVKRLLDYYYAEDEKQGPSPDASLMAAPPKETKPEIQQGNDPYSFLGRYAKALRSAFDTEEEFVRRYKKEETSTAPNLSSRVKELQDIVFQEDETVNTYYDESYFPTPKRPDLPEFETYEAPKGLFTRPAPKVRPKLKPGSNDFIEGALNTIMESEGGFQRDKNDSGNYVGGKLIGTNRGITPAALAESRGVAASSITVEDMKNITDREARDIFVDQYFYKPKIDRLPTDLQDTVFDMQINSGNNAIKILQRLAGVEADGVLGEESIKAIKDKGITRESYNEARVDYYNKVAKNDPKKKKFLQGWLNRVAKYM